MELYEILVPTIMNEKPVKTRHHKAWDAKVERITGGLTILHPTKGKWRSPDKILFQERMIPVRISCTREQLDKIIDITLRHYNQIAVAAYKVSDDFIIKYKNNT